MKSVRTILIGMVAAGALSLSVVPSLAALPGAGACWSPAQVTSAIAQGTIKSWAQIRRIAGIPNDLYETSPVQVCLLHGTPYFIVNMSSPKGENVKIVRSAIDGSA